MSQRQRIWLSNGSWPEVDVFPTPVPGLVIYAGLHTQEGKWIVGHSATGGCVLVLPDPEAALHAAIRLGELADWRQPGAALYTQDIHSQVAGLAKDLGCYELTFSTPSATLEELAAADARGGS